LEVTEVPSREDKMAISKDRPEVSAKAKGDFSTLTPDGRVVMDTDRLIRSPEVQATLAVLEQKVQPAEQLDAAIKRRLADSPRREALSCSPDELVETSWDQHLAVLPMSLHSIESMVSLRTTR
jgi:hypothetical protein